MDPERTREMRGENLGEAWLYETDREKPAGEWQTYDITLVDRHVTVILNGKKIHE